jgi:hypothetical protein
MSNKRSVLARLVIVLLEMQDRSMQCCFDASTFTDLNPNTRICIPHFAVAVVLPTHLQILSQDRPQLTVIGLDA